MSQSSGGCFTVAGMTLLWLVAASGSGRAQPCPTDPLPLTHAPIAGLDPQTVILGSFDASSAMQSPAGTQLVKATHVWSATGGIFGTGSLSVPPSGGSVAIYPSAGFNAATGTIEMWFKPGAPSLERRYLFSLAGSRSLDADGHQELIVGETTGSASMPAQSAIYFHGPSGGIDLGQPATFPTNAPRGIAVGDVNGDGHLDLVIANNYASTLPTPATPGTPGEVHVFHGPITKGTALSTPNTVLEVDLVQGLVLAPFDEHPGLDLIVASYHDGTPPLYGFSNNGAGQFTPMNFTWVAGSDATAEGLSVGDVDHDGVLDVLFANLEANGPSAVFLGTIVNGDYRITSANSSQFSTRSVASLGASLADVDADGWLDAVLSQPFGGAGNGGRIVIHRNKGDGTFDANPNAEILTTRPFTVNAERDLNSDGHLDIVVANWRTGGPQGPVTDASTVFYGPFSVPAVATLPTPTLIPPAAKFLVDDAVSMTIGDIDENGIDDLVFHASRGTTSPAFLLDADGQGTAGVDSMGRWQPSLLIGTQPSQDNPAGEGAGLHVAASGTTTYGTNLVRYDTFELFLEDGLLHFVVFDHDGVAHAVSVPFPPAADPHAKNGFHHVAAEWSAAAGVVSLTIGHPAFPAGTSTAWSSPFVIGPIGKVFRLGSNCNNQNRAHGARFDDVRVSKVRRSQLDFDADGVPNDWDNCPFLANPSQADANQDGRGDVCSFCQTSIGFQGPGNLTLSVCGAPLTSNALAVLRLRCGESGAYAVLFVSLQKNPIPALGGTFVPSPVLAQAVVFLDANGSLTAPFKGPKPTAPFKAYVQVVATDSSLPLGIEFSNALELQFLP